MDEHFPALVTDKLAPALARYGIEITSQDRWCVEMASPRVNVRAAFDPRGELDVEVYPSGSQNWEGWSYVGMLGRASLERLLEIALVAMEADPRTLEGDPDFLAECAKQRGQQPRHLP